MEGGRRRSGSGRGVPGCRRRHATAEPGPTLLAYSQTLFSRPSDWPSAAYPAGFLEPWPELRARFGEIGLPNDLDRWLQAGPPPVFFGFGSMPVLDHGAMLRTIRKGPGRARPAGDSRRGVERARCRRRRLTVRGRRSRPPEPVPPLRRGRSPRWRRHDRDHRGRWHPGARLLGLRRSAFLGARCRALGIGDTFPFVKLDARRLSAGLRCVLETPVALRAKEVGRLMVEEDGVGAAVGYLEREFLNRR